MKATLFVIRLYFKVASALVPSLAARQAFRVFQKVRIKNIRQREEQFYQAVKTFEIPHDKETIRGYELGPSNGELVVLVHGWESNAGSMSQIASRLSAEGKRVVLFDLPGHAFYENDHTNLLECKDAMKDVLSYLNPSAPVSIVSHSFGSAVTAFCVRETDYKIDKMVFLTGPNRVENIFLEFKGIVSLGNRAYGKMVDMTERILGEPISNISIANNLKNGNYSDLLLIHDKHDKILPYSNSQEITSSVKSNLETFENVGHYRMLWNKDIINRCADFLN